MSEKKLTIAVISDLHCHPRQTKADENRTLLFSDLLRDSEIDHPVQNLLNIISEKEISVDLVLCPGDFTNGCNLQGFLSGWSYVQEISRTLNATETIATIGNHDVDSRHNRSEYYLDMPKGIKQNFPIHSKHAEKIKEFWADGHCFIEDESYLILVINSTHYHTHEAGREGPTIRGKVNKNQIQEIDKYLKLHHDESKIRIAMFHHHPIEHSRLNLGNEDLIENGTDLMNVLGEHNFDLVVHGHKHDPWLRYHPTHNGFEIPILSAGSFSATDQISYINKFNYFHVLHISKKSGENANALINTWVYKAGNGWALERRDQDGFYSHTGFGHKGEITSIIERIKEIFSNTKKTVLDWDMVADEISELKFLTPDKMEKLQSSLELAQIIINPMIGMKPKHVYYHGK